MVRTKNIFVNMSKPTPRCVSSHLFGYKMMFGLCTGHLFAQPSPIKIFTPSKLFPLMLTHRLKTSHLHTTLGERQRRWAPPCRAASSRSASPGPGSGPDTTTCSSLRRDSARGRPRRTRRPSGPRSTRCTATPRRLGRCGSRPGASPWRRGPCASSLRAGRRKS